MNFFIGFRTKLDPTVEQRIYFAKACGVARFAWNWALAEWKRRVELHHADPSVPYPTEAALRRDLNAIKRKEFPWMLEVTKCAPQQSIMNLGKALKNHFANPKHFGFPKFKKKFKHDSFTISNDQVKVEGSRLRIPNLGWVRMHEPFGRFKDAKILSVTISRQADSWFVSIQCQIWDLSHLIAAENQGRVGVDLGINRLATLSNGMEFYAPKPLQAMLGKLKRQQRKYSRAKKGSKNCGDLKERIARLHARIRNIRQDALHKLTTYLSSHFSSIVIEDLNVSGMLKNRHLSRAIADIGFYEFRRQLDYKVRMRGGELIVADRFFPSSKLCRFCGQKHDGLELSDREWVCPHCGRKISDRDLNAAINLRDYPDKFRGIRFELSNAAQSASTPDSAPSAVDHRKVEQAASSTKEVPAASAGRVERAALAPGRPEAKLLSKIGENTPVKPCSDIQ